MEYIELFLKGVAVLVIAGCAVVLVFVSAFVGLALFTKWDERP